VAVVRKEKEGMVSNSNLEFSSRERALKASFIYL
jgi:hypothetical protein